METIRGKESRELDLSELRQRLAGYDQVHLDLGTGDGRYVQRLAKQAPGQFAIGVDACRENLRGSSCSRLENLLFVIANAQQLPLELQGLAQHVTIYFPWGSLLGDLLAGEAGLLRSLCDSAHPGTWLDLLINAGALADAGSELEVGALRIRANLEAAGWRMQSPATVEGGDLRRIPTTWARRLAHGRDPRALMLRGRLGR